MSQTYRINAVHEKKDVSGIFEAHTHHHAIEQWMQKLSERDDLEDFPWKLPLTVQRIDEMSLEPVTNSLKFLVSTEFIAVPIIEDLE